MGDRVWCEEARAAYGSYRELMGLPAVQRSRSAPEPQDREADMREIRRAVEAGEMTAEAGRARACRIRAGAALDAGEVTRDGVRPMYEKCVSGAKEETRRR